MRPTIRLNIVKFIVISLGNHLILAVQNSISELEHNRFKILLKPIKILLYPAQTKETNKRKIILLD